MDLTTQQKEALSSMRTAFSSVNGEGLPMEDRTYLRYLRARHFDVGLATTMLQTTIQWRRDFDIKSLHDGWEKTIMEENKTGKGYVRGFSRAGNVLLYLRPKHENTFEHDGNLKHLVYNMERAVSCLEADGRGVEKLILLIDYDGYSLLNAPPMKTSTETLSILQNHYPERLARAYCIRPPWIFSAFWTVISPFIDPVTFQKIQMVGGSPADIGARLNADGIDPSSLESDIGGTDARPFVSRVYLGSGLPRSSAGPGSSSGEVLSREEAFTMDYARLASDKEEERAFSPVGVAEGVARAADNGKVAKKSWSFW